MCHGVRLIAVSSDLRLRQFVESALQAEGHRALCVSTADEALLQLHTEEDWDYLLLDVNPSQPVDAFFSAELIQRVGSEKTSVVAALGSNDWKPQAKKWNIRGLLTKPLLREDLAGLIAHSDSPAFVHAGKSASPLAVQASPYLLEELGSYGFFLAASPAMIRMYREIQVLASVDYPLLILGESGVGKEVVSRLLHKYSARSNYGFVNVNTAAIPSELLESELFGYEAGAFTGAVKTKPGKFELANKGTLLLDEIGEMSLQMQAKLLHVLQDGSFSRLGARHSMQTDVRILAATNVNMEEAIEKKQFREDLYYRLNAFTITVPSLRERREEIPMLMEQIMARGCAGTGRIAQPFTSSLIEAAQEYHWPGNLRELRNFVTRLLVLQDQNAAYNDLRAKTRAKAPNVEGKRPAGTEIETPIKTQLTLRGVINDQKQQTESRMIKEALSASGWNRRRAATTLQISYRALLYKIQQHNLAA